MKKYLLSVLAVYFLAFLPNLISRNTDYCHNLTLKNNQAGLIAKIPNPQSQKPEKYIPPKSLKSAIESMLSSGNPAIAREGEHLQSMAYEVQPRLYLKDGIETLTGSSLPRVIDTDVSSLFKLYENSAYFQQTELIIIHIRNSSELSEILDVGRLAGFPNLKYIHFLSDITVCSSPGCEPDRFNDMVQGNEVYNYLILFEISILQ